MEHIYTRYDCSGCNQIRIVNNDKQNDLNNEKHEQCKNQNGYWYLSCFNNHRDYRKWFLLCLQAFYKNAEYFVKNPHHIKERFEYENISYQLDIIDVLIKLEDTHCLLAAESIYELIKYQYDLKFNEFYKKILNTEDINERFCLANYLNVFISQLEQDVKWEIPEKKALLELDDNE